ncbi:putative PEP-CTERM system TPR-repeat lipoprotein [Marinibacterium anthonyi]|nr:putative PEP-CTERM system TPR-repeat lipoprotein [Marinibacterium anthonyi]
MPLTSGPRRRIAIFGTFDVENYGDLLFPLVAGQCLGRFGVDVVPVSPTSDRVCYTDAIPPLSIAEFARTASGFDGVLIGGGNIIHVRDFGLPAYDAIAYPMLWAGATAHAVRHAIPVMWNAPGVLPLRDPGTPPGWLTRVAQAADHFTVRDTHSAHVMGQWSGRRPDVMPDSVLDLARLWPRDMMLDRCRALRDDMGIGKDTPVIALHVKRRSLGTMDVAAFSAALALALEDAGAVAVLLAIGRCHDDHTLVREIHAAAGARTVPFEDADALQDIAAMIAGSDAYVGASLHGHITAAAYGTPARVVTVPALHKFIGQAQLMDRADELVPDWATALTDFRTVLSEPLRPLPAEVGTRLSQHWSAAAALVQNGAAPNKAMIFGDAPIEDALRRAVQDQTTPPRPSRRSGRATNDTRKTRRSGMTQDTLTDWDSAKINGLISSGEHDSATTQIDAVLEQRPSFLPARLAQIRLRMAAGDRAEASEMSLELADEVPDNPWVWLLAMQAHAATGDVETAKAIFDDGFDRLSPPDQVLSAALSALLPVLGGTKEQIAFLQEALKIRPDDQTLQIRLATRAHLAGDVKLSLDMLTKAEAQGPLPAFAQRVRTQLLPHLTSMDEAADELARQVDAGGEDAETLCRLCRYAAAAGRFEQSQTALLRALDLHPLEWRPLYRLNRIFLPAAQDAEIFAKLDTLRLEADTDRNWRLQFAFFALRVGETAIAQDVLQTLSDDPVVGPTARDLLAAVKATGEPHPRPEVIADDDVRVVRKDGAQGTIVVFGNFLGGISYVPDRYLDNLLADLPANVIYMRDPHGRVYLNGIPQLGPDEAAMQQALRDRLADLGGGRVVTMGSSASGYAALRAGLAIGADAVISLAGLITPGRGDEQDPLHNRMGMEELFGRDPEAMDLRPALAAKKATHLTLVIGAEYEPDIGRSRVAKDLDNATVHLMPGVTTHHSAIPAIADGTLVQLLTAALDPSPTSAESKTAGSKSAGSKSAKIKTAKTPRGTKNRRSSKRRKS